MSRPLDVSRVREALKGPGADTRYWVSYGTVGTVDDQGNTNFEDPRAVHIAPDGVYCDVILMPTQLPVTCRYPGSAGGTGVQVITPIHPGDEVLVTLPDGSANSPPVIAAVLNSQSNKIPRGADRRPLFKNDRVLIFAKDVDLDLRTEGGARVEVRQDDQVVVTSGDVRLGDEGATQPAIRGDDYRFNEREFLSSLQTFLAGLQTYANAIQPIADPTTLATTALTAVITEMTAAAAAFRAQDSLSATVKLR